ncbi:dnaJ homolog subfamily C member 14 [Spea bombifrons]|uniref:dnaJ homolog subfamily C member 14 n=1 Tax=Spea bombifrons TaxID=233779 RepID=UPI00234A781B|nr:dnaJ homolog subfamily C member 14 [Spea bombifrons]
MMEKQLEGGIGNGRNASPVQPCTEEIQEKRGTRVSMQGNCLFKKKNVRLYSEQNGTGISEQAPGWVESQASFVDKHSCFPHLNRSEGELTPEQSGNEEDIWTKEFLTEEKAGNILAPDLNEIFDHQPMPDTASHGPPSPFELNCGCTTNTDPSGGTYSDIGDHTCRRGCHHFSPYLQRPLDEEREEDGENGKQMEADDDSWKGASGRRGGRRGKARPNLRGELRRDGRQPQHSSGKHKLGRKKSHGEGRHQLKTLVPQPLILLSTSCVQLIIDFVRLIGKYVEMLGMLLYTRVLLPARDLNLLKIQLQTFGLWTYLRAKDSWHLTCCFGLWLLRVLKMLCALLFLLLMLTVGCVRLCWQYVKRTVSRVDGDNRWGSWISIQLHRIWALLTQNRTSSRLFSQFGKWKSRLWKFRTHKEPSWSSAGFPNSGRYQPGEEVERLLTLADIPEEELNPFQVLDVDVKASDTELKKAYRQLAVLVHPDKNNHPRAEEAFKVLRAAWDTVSNPEKRKEYEMKKMSESELAKSMNEFLTKLQDDLKEAMNSMMCSKCQGKHRRFEMDRDPANARYCADCGKMHPAEEGDFWAESSMLGLKITYFAMMQGKVFDITEWAGCQRVGISPDTHRVPYHISFGSRNPTNPARRRAPSESSPTSVADLQNILNRIFQGSPGQMPNRDIFNTSQQPPQGAQSPSGPPKPESAPRSDTKSKRKKKVRRPLQR